MDKELHEIEKLLTEYVNKYDVNNIDIIIYDLWKQKSVKLIKRH